MSPDLRFLGVCFCFGSGFPADRDPHPGHSSRAAGPDDPRSDSDSTGGPAEAHAAASRDHGGGPAADPRGSQPSPGAGQLRQPEPAAQAPDESPCRQAKDAHQASVPLVGRAGRPQAGHPCLPPSRQDGVDFIYWTPGQCHAGCSAPRAAILSEHPPFMCYVTDWKRDSGNFS